MCSRQRLALLCLTLLACSRSERTTPGAGSPAGGRGAIATPAASTAAAVSAVPPASAPKIGPSPPKTAPSAQLAQRYPWLATEAGRALPPDGSLGDRIAPPPGYQRVPVEPGSFSEWLRGLPLARPATAVTRHDGEPVRSGDDDYVAAVVAIDVGAGDLQQSPDVIVRLHAEWLWSKGEKNAIGYRGANRLSMPLSRWEKGQRLVAGGPTAVFWAVKTKPKEADYEDFRRYLDAVFAWGNSTSLAQRSERLEDPQALAPGDFFLHARPPGHVAIVLDVAAKPSGERLALLGQALNPAQSVHVLRPGRATAWFSLRPGSPVVTPYTREFTWTELRRLEPLREEEVSDESAPEAPK